MTTENIFASHYDALKNGGKGNIFEGEILALWGVFLIRRNLGFVNKILGG